MLNRILELLIMTIKWFAILLIVLWVFSFVAAMFGSEIGLEFIDKVFFICTDIAQHIVDFINWLFGEFESKTH